MKLNMGISNNIQQYNIKTQQQYNIGIHPNSWATSPGSSLPKWACPLVLKALKRNTRLKVSQ